MKRCLPFLFLPLFFSSCIVINGNGYKQLSKSQRVHVHQFDTSDLGKIKSSGDNFYPVEITAQDITNEINKGGYVWIHNWVPYCKAESCRMLSYYEQLFDKISTDPINSLITVSYIYDSSQIARQVNRAGAQRYVFVPKDSLYGHQVYKAMDRLMLSYLKDSIELRMPHQLYHKGKLIYYGGDMTVEQFMALIKQNEQDQL